MNTIAAPHASYAEYVASLSPRWPEYRWLFHFLTEQSTPTGSSAIVIDSTDNRLSVNAIRRVRKPSQNIFDRSEDKDHYSVLSATSGR